MIKKYILTSSIILLIMIGLILFSNYTKQPVNYVVFAWSQNTSEESQKSLIACLETKEILYRVDNNDNVEIPEKAIQKAVSYCS